MSDLKKFLVSSLPSSVKIAIFELLKSVSIMFTSEDLLQLKERGLTEEDVLTQLTYFKEGFPALCVVSAATVGNGIMRIGDDDQAAYIEAWNRYCQRNCTIVKFVPASGAASRMFKDLFAFLDADYDEPRTDFEKRFFSEIEKFAFYDALNACCLTHYDKNIPGLLSLGKYKAIVRALLLPEGMNYGSLPKGLLLFHKYPDGNRTPTEEHMVESAYYAKDRNGRAVLHFTVSPEHRGLFEKLTAEKSLLYGQRLNTRYDISFSIQKPSTDTIAVDMNNEPFRDENGRLVFRPGGHGALIENLDAIEADVIFIKNIDNVVPDRLKDNETRYKKLLAGVLVKMQERAFRYMEKLESGNATTDDLSEMLRFTENELCIRHEDISLDSEQELRNYLVRKLNRPFRVCGMVKNQGEPGGGPFIVKNPDGTASPQILESSQINPDDPVAMNAFRNGTHFNPVDLVCSVKNHKGEKYRLPDYVDRNTGFISIKSKNGRELKALEHPGLWNGGMSDWNTVFVEVPVSTFNPVKTVIDLLRPEHQ
jgi:hypothetical protein